MNLEPRIKLPLEITLYPRNITEGYFQFLDNPGVMMTCRCPIALRLREMGYPNVAVSDLSITSDVSDYGTAYEKLHPESREFVYFWDRTRSLVDDLEKTRAEDWLAAQSWPLTLKLTRPRN